MIMRFLKPIWFVAVIPLLKGLIQYLIYRNVTGILSLEAVALGIIIVFAVFRWRSIMIEVKGGGLTVRQGFIIKRVAHIEPDVLSCVSIRQNPVDVIFRSVSCRINTEAGRPARPDFDIKLYVNDAKVLSGIVYGSECNTSICTSPFKIALMAATTSSSVSGLLVGVPVANQAADLFGVALSDIILEELTHTASKFSVYFPTAVSVITLLLIIAYVFAALVSFQRNLFFRVKMGEDRLDVCSGLFVKRRTVFRKRSVNAVMIEQTPLMRLCRRFSMSVSIAGYGDKKGDRAIIAPCGRRYEMRRQFMLFFPFLSCDGKIVKAKRGRRTKQRFFFVPAVAFTTVTALTVLLLLLFPRFDRFIFFLAVFASLIICYYSNLCIYNYRFGRVRFSDNISARSSNGFNIRELYCEKDKIGEIKLIRYPADRRFNTCKVKLTVRSEGADSIRIRNVDFATVKEEIYSCF